LTFDALAVATLELQVNVSIVVFGIKLWWSGTGNAMLRLLLTGLNCGRKHERMLANVLLRLSERA